MRSVRGTFAALFFASLLVIACGSDGADPAPTPTRTPTATVTPTATRTASPTPTATPDPLDVTPARAEDAAAVLGEYLAGEPPLCDQVVVERWGGTCIEGDVDGDGENDAAYLVALAGGRGVSPEPAVVLLHRTGSEKLDRFPLRDDADDSGLGRAMFGLADRNGDEIAEITLVATRCGASTCVSRVEVLSWDGTAWRDIGPGEPGITNPESIAWEGEGAASVLVTRSGPVGSIGAGPTRAVTTRFSLEAGFYHSAVSEPDDPEYLVHAIEDADALFIEGLFGEAIAAYEAAIADSTLRDWKVESGQPAGRPALEGYALFRIAVATAASGSDPVAAFDAVIVGSGEPLFAEAVQAFRRGYQDGFSVIRGCIEVTRYMASPAARAVLENRFDYGYANPRMQPEDVCPL